MMASSKSAITGTIWLKPVTNKAFQGEGDWRSGDEWHSPLSTFKFLLKSVLAHFQLISYSIHSTGTLAVTGTCLQGGLQICHRWCADPTISLGDE